jgi:hypothetical protein
MYTNWPTIDPSTHHFGVSHLRQLNADKLRTLDTIWVIHANNEPIAVVIPYQRFLEMQSDLEKLKNAT